MSLPKMISYTGPARANDGRLPVTEQANGQVGLSTKGSRGPWVASGSLGQGQLYKGFTDANVTLTPAQCVGAHIGFPTLGGARVITLPTAEDILSYIGSDLCAPPATVPNPVAQTDNTGVSYLGVSFPFTIGFQDGTNTVQFGTSAGIIFKVSGNPAIAGTTSLGPLNPYPSVARFKLVVQNATPGSAQIAVYRDY